MKALRLVLFTVAVLLVLAAATAGAAWLYIRRGAVDGPPPDDAHLKIERVELPDDENAFTILCAMTNMWFEKEEYAESLDKILDGRSWDEAVAEKIVQVNQGMFFSIEESLKCPGFQVPERRNVGSSTAYLEDWREITKLMQLRARMFLVQGKHVQAFEQALAVVHLGHRIEECGGAVIHYLVGLSVKHMGLLLIEQMLPYFKPDPIQFRTYAGKLGEFGASEDALVSSLKEEYRICRNTVEDLAGGRLGFEEAGIRMHPFAAALGVTPYLLQVHNTQRRFAEFYTGVIEAVPLNQAEVPRRMPTLEGSAPTLKDVLIKPNYIGRLLGEKLLPFSLTIVERKNGERLYVNSMRLRLLIVAYEMEHGSVPASLEDLVGEDLDRAPTDPYDGEPIRYSAGERKIYSVGRDLKDSGGSTAAPTAPAGLPDQQRRWIAEDIVFEF